MTDALTKAAATAAKIAFFIVVLLLRMPPDWTHNLQIGGGTNSENVWRF